MVAHTPEPKYHLRGERVTRPSYMQQQIIRRVEQVCEEDFVLEVLVGEVGCCDGDVEGFVHHAVDHTPVGAVFL